MKSLSATPGKFLHTCLLLVFILACWGPRGVRGEEAAQAGEKLYKNEKHGYTVRYPSTWFPSGIVYGNAFEIRNYEPQNPQARAPQDQASLLILDMPMGSPEEANRFLDSLLAQGSHAEREVKALTLDGRRAIRVKERLKAQEPGPGAARRLATPPPTPGLSSLIHLSTYILDRAHVLHLWGRAWVGSDPAVIGEIIRIQESVTFERKEG